MPDLKDRGWAPADERRCTAIVQYPFGDPQRCHNGRWGGRDLCYMHAKRKPKPELTLESLDARLTALEARVAELRAGLLQERGVSAYSTQSGGAVKHQ